MLGLTRTHPLSQFVPSGGRLAEFKLNDNERS